MSAIELAVSAALSAALTIAVGLGLALITNEVPRVAIATILTGMTISFSLLATRKSPPSKRHGAVSPSTRNSLWSARWVPPTVAVCLVLTGLLAYLSWRLYLTPAPSSTYTALFLDYQHSARAIVVVNHETKIMRFRLTISQHRQTIASRTFTLAIGAEYRLPLPRTPVARAPIHEHVYLMTEPANILLRSLSFVSAND
jgi:hypothetical protein